MDGVNSSLSTKSNSDISNAVAEKGLTATEITRHGGVSQQAVSNALNGNRMGRVKVVPAICKALDLLAKDIVIIED